MVDATEQPETPEPDGSAREAWESRDLRQLAEELLEFPRVRQMLAGHTRFFLSRERALKIKPRTDAEDVVRLQSETAEARAMLDAAGDIGLTGTVDLGPCL